MDRIQKMKVRVLFAGLSISDGDITYPMF